MSLNKLKTTIYAGVGTSTLYATRVLAQENAEKGAEEISGGLSQDALTASISNIVNILIFVIGMVAVIMLIVGGFRYVFSQGNEKAVQGAKDTILYSIIGIIVAVLAFAIVNFVLGGLISGNPGA